MLTGLTGLVLNKVAGLGDLAHIVIIRAHATEQSIGANCLSGQLGNRANLQTMVVSARSIQGQMLKQRSVGVAPLQQSHAGSHLEKPLDERQDTLYQKTDRYSGANRPKAVK